MWGKGVSEVVPFFVSSCMSILAAKVAKFASKHGVFLFQFWCFFSSFLGVIRDPFGNYRGLHEVLLAGLWRQKPLNL